MRRLKVVGSLANREGFRLGLHNTSRCSRVRPTNTICYMLNAYNAEIIAIKGKSHRQKEAQERAEQRGKKRKATSSRSTA